MAFITVCTMAFSLVMLGVFLMISFNLSQLSEYVTSKIEIRVFLKETLTVREVQQFQRELQQEPHVDSVTFVNRDRAWRQFKNDYESLHLANYLDQNPLPHMFKVSLTDNEFIIPVGEQIQNRRQKVEKVFYGGDVAGRIHQFSKFIRWFGLGLGSVLTLFTLLIIVNTIRLTIMSRQTEISIMKLVGATDRFISGPFLIEGCLFGVFGALFSVAFLNSVYVFGTQFVLQKMPFVPVLLEASEMRSVYVILGILGVLLGVLGARISVSKSLKVTI